jgi:two-component system cell cycle response regulator DivK
LARLLIVEDNPDNMKLVRTVLSSRGHEVVELPGGERLLDTMRETQPALVILDIQLPGADGFQLLARLHEHFEELPPVIALTAHAMAGDRERAMQAGFNGYLTKPIDVSTFARTIESFLTEGLER